LCPAQCKGGIDEWIGVQWRVSMAVRYLRHTLYKKMLRRRECYRGI